MKIIIFEYKKRQYLYKGKPIKITYSKKDKIGNIIKIKNIILIYKNNKKIEIGRPYILKENKEIELKIINFCKKKKLSIKFKRRKRYKKIFGYKIEKTIVKLNG